MSRSYTLAQLADLVGGTLRGDGSLLIRGVNDVTEAGPDQITWISGEQYASRLATSKAGAVLVPEGFGDTKVAAILCAGIDRAVARLLGAFAPLRSRPAIGVHPSAVVDSSARLGAGCRIGPHATIAADAGIGTRCTLHPGVCIGQGATVGDDCEFEPNVVIGDACVLGNRVVIHANSVVGSDGFGYYFDEARHHKVPHTGAVWIEDDVEIGACSCIDRAKFGYTRIGTGTKIDNLVQVAHNVRIGRHNVLAGTTGLAGSARTGDYCVLGGRTSVLDGVVLGDRVRMASAALADKDIAMGLTVSGNPAQDHRAELRERATLRRLPKLLEQMKELLGRVEQLEASTHHRP